VKVPAELIKFLRRENRFLIATHIDPEADAIGSSVALFRALRSLGKDVIVYNRDLVPRICQFLPGSDAVTDQIPERLENLILMDCNIPKRAGLDGKEARFAVVIDHHKTENDFGNIRWIMPEAPATGLMTYFLIRELGVSIDSEMATNLYAAIGIDTGIFRYPNTDATSLEVAGELVRHGARPGEIAERLFNNFTKKRFILFQRMLENMEILDELAITVIPSDFFEETGTTAEDTENFVNTALVMEDIKISALMRELKSGSWKVSLRSKGDVDISTVAVLYGGGGHRNASGCIIEESDIETAKRMLVKELLVKLK